MNMKKTMAAIAAGAVSVSAMATSVSALQDGTFTYNLVENYKQAGDSAKVTQEATINNADSTLTGLTFVDTDGKITVKNVTVKVASSEAGEQNKTYTYSTDQGAVNYNSNLSDGGLVFVNELVGYTGKLTVTVTIDAAETSYGSTKKVNADIDAGKVAIQGVGVTDVTPTVVRVYTGAGDSTYTKIPFKTSTSNNLNIINYLQYGNYSAGGKGGVRTNDSNYTNVAAVLNDAIANYESVVFTFNTATQNIAWMADPDLADADRIDIGRGGDTWGLNHFGCAFWDNGNTWSAKDNNDVTYVKKDLLASVGGNENNIVAVYVDDWAGTDAYKSFNQHLYNGTVNQYYDSLLGNFQSEGTGYIGFDWNGYNLFQGALVINENLTMSLQDTDYFDYTNTSLSFDWDAIMDGAATSNNFATYVQSIKLATSTTWYWDNMTVVLTAGAAEDAGLGAGTEGDEGSLDDSDDIDDGDDIIDDDDDFVDDDDDFVDDGDDVDDTPVVDNTVSNPQTGNAPVALAVIPVALAAAAVVAKKRG